MSYARAYALADQLQRNHRDVMRIRRQPNFVQTAAVLYEIGLRNGLPVNKITAGIVSAGFVITKAATNLGIGTVKAISQFAV
jgi:hypothetical protein